jgi:putative PIN family toxin of toxin-antitoxin system
VKVVLDTNVLVSGLITEVGACGQIVDLLLEAAFEACVDARVLQEYGTVLPRPKFRIRPERVAATLDFLLAEAEVVSPTALAVELPDPSDLPFLEVAAQAGAILVTGNPRHFPKDRRAGVTVLRPREFLDLLAQSP